MLSLSLSSRLRLQGLPVAAGARPGTIGLSFRKPCTLASRNQRRFLKSIYWADLPSTSVVRPISTKQTDDIAALQQTDGIAALQQTLQVIVHGGMWPL